MYGENANGIDSLLIKIASVAGVCLFTLLASAALHHGIQAENEKDDLDYGVA